MVDVQYKTMTRNPLSADWKRSASDLKFTLPEGELPSAKVRLVAAPQGYLGRAQVFGTPCSEDLFSLAAVAKSPTFETMRYRRLRSGQGRRRSSTKSGSPCGTSWKLDCRNSLLHCQ